MAKENAASTPGLGEWFRASRRQSGLLPTLGRLGGALVDFLRESTPERRRSRYGDVDFDWEHRVDTTSATVTARERFLGLLHSPYQPTEAGLFHEMIASVAEIADLHQLTFVDIGSGKGRALLMASEYPFRRIIGVELMPRLHEVAVANIADFKAKGSAVIESLCGDAAEFEFPDGPLMLYMFNPLPRATLARMVSNLGKSLTEKPRHILLLYHNPLLEEVVAGASFLFKRGGTPQYAVYSN